MTASTYFAANGSVFVVDGPWQARLSEDQCDTLLTIWEAANAPTLFNALWEACEAVGFCPWHSPPKSTVISFGRAKLRRQLVASLALETEGGR